MFRTQKLDLCYAHKRCCLSPLNTYQFSQWSIERYLCIVTVLSPASYSGACPESSSDAWHSTDIQPSDSLHIAYQKRVLDLAEDTGCFVIWRLSFNTLTICRVSSVSMILSLLKSLDTEAGGDLEHAIEFSYFSEEWASSCRYQWQNSVIHANFREEGHRLTFHQKHSSIKRVRRLCCVCNAAGSHPMSDLMKIFGCMSYLVQLLLTPCRQSRWYSPSSRGFGPGVKTDGRYRCTNMHRSLPLLVWKHCRSRFASRMDLTLVKWWLPWWLKIDRLEIASSYRGFLAKWHLKPDH